MESKEKIYEELNELIHTVNDVSFLYEIKHKIEEHQQTETMEAEEEWTDVQLAKLNKHNYGEPITRQNFVTLAEYKKVHEFEDDLFGDKDWADELSDEQKAELEADLAEEDTDENCVSQEEFDKMFAKWRSK